MASRLSLIGILLSLQILQMQTIRGQKPCASGTCGVGSECIRTDQIHSCQCRSGYFDGQWDNNLTTFTCVDLDECQRNVHLCRRNTQCENSDGGYSCNCVHPNQTLWIAPSLEQQCTDSDVDICATDLKVCGTGTQCVSSGVGEYNCPCTDGFENVTYSIVLEVYVCTDTNECSISTHNCGSNAICVNHVGHFTCYCPNTMQLWTDHLGKQVCTDGDICQSDTHICASGTMCVSDVSALVYNCTCLSGFTGLQQSSPNTILCTDQNECEDGNHACDDNAICTNTIGAFSCTCQQGYNSSTGNGFNCNDIDECSNEDLFTCQANAECVNTFGSYNCQCKPEFFSSTSNGESCEAKQYIDVGIAIAVAIIVAIAVIGLLIVWFNRERCKPQETAKLASSHDVGPVLGRSTTSLTPSFMTPSLQLGQGNSSHTGSLSSMATPKQNGVTYINMNDQTYEPHSITNRPVRSRKRLHQARRSYPSSYISRQSSQLSYPSRSSVVGSNGSGTKDSSIRELHGDEASSTGHGAIGHGAIGHASGREYKGKQSKSTKYKRIQEKNRSVSRLSVLGLEESQLAPEEVIAIESTIVTPDSTHPNAVFSMPDSLPADNSDMDEAEYDHLNRQYVRNEDPERPRSLRSALRARVTDSSLYNGPVDGSGKNPSQIDLISDTHDADEHEDRDIAL